MSIEIHFSPDISAYEMHSFFVASARPKLPRLQSIATAFSIVPNYVVW